MKKIISFILALTLMLTIPSVSDAADTSSKRATTIHSSSINMNATDKKIFAEEKDALYNATSASKSVTSVDSATIDTLMASATFATGSERESLLQQLEQYGVYLYNSCSSMIQPRSDSGDVTLNAPYVFYSSSANTWTVAFSGTWKNNNWLEQSLIGNIGGADGFGVAYTNASNYATYVVGASAYITDQNSDIYETTSNRSDGDGARGFGFRLQDYRNASYAYVGYKWYGSCTYNSNFANFSGTATAYYIHTYSSTSISSISFSGGTNGINITATFSGDKKYFSAYSGDTPF